MTAIYDDAQPPAANLALIDAKEPLAALRSTLAQQAEYLHRRFADGAPAGELVYGRARFIDELLISAWHSRLPQAATDIALVAVGGYGRGELHPQSDIDLMVLLDGERHEFYRDSIEQLWVLLWDIGLEVGHSVRSVDDCAHEAQRDIAVITPLMEARLLTGPVSLFERMRQAIAPDRMWNSREFFAAKTREQQARHHKFGNTAYNLEPNIKESPGGLRDIQMIAWVAQRHFGAVSLHDLVEHKFLNEDEYAQLLAGRELLWRIRFALHSMTKRREDRLLFDHQRALAEQFGYGGAQANQAVEQFMQNYFRTVMELNRLNEMLLQLFEEAILHADERDAVLPLNKRFQARKGFIEVTATNVFQRYPFALLEIFLLLQQHAELKGVRASTIRLIRTHCHLIDDRFRADLRARALFMEIMRQPRGLTAQLRRMNRYGVLAAYIPAFSAIVGRMQYDLFHVYTVDEHTLSLVRNLRRYFVPEFAHEFPLCSEIVTHLPKPELLYLAGLFHDIGKGRGGDHSELGADEAETFCLHHGLSRYDARLVAWLVRNHLLMSSTAQRRDTSDPEVISTFARSMGDQVHLNYLYPLTVADIRATNPSLWNAWRNALLLELYTQTRRALRRGLENPIDKEERLSAVKKEVNTLLARTGIDASRMTELWSDFSEDYFWRYSADEIAWHMQAIATAAPGDLPVVLVRRETQRGGTEIFIYAHAQDHLFALVTAVLDQLGLTIVDARLTSAFSGYTLDTYLVLEEQGHAVADAWRVEEILATLKTKLNAAQQTALPALRSVPRQARHFRSPTVIDFSVDEEKRLTVVELITADRPGLLSCVGRIFQNCGLRVRNAKVATLGARAEDVFFITDQDGNPLRDQAGLNDLRQRLIDALDSEAN